MQLPWDQVMSPCKHYRTRLRRHKKGVEAKNQVSKFSQTELDRMKQEDFLRPVINFWLGYWK